MQPEKLVARLDALLQAPAGVETRNLSRPSVANLDARDKGLADAEIDCDIALHSAFRDLRQNRPIAGVQGFHAGALAGYDFKRAIRLLGLDGGEGARVQQKVLDVGSVGYGVAKKPPIVLAGRTPIFFDAAVAEAGMDGVQCRSKCVGEANANAAFGLVNFDAALAVKEACDVAPESVVRPVFHHGNYISQFLVSNNAIMAVPVIRWLGERIQAVEALTLRAAA